MKKIWPWLIALLLLIVICIGTKKDTIQQTQDKDIHNIASPILIPQDKPITYKIIKTSNTYIAEGTFTDNSQISSLIHTCKGSKILLDTTSTHIDPTLAGEEAIHLTNTILPHFIKHYKNGKIVYKNKMLIVTGDLSQYKVKNEMQSLLNTSTLASRDDSKVIIKKPINYIIRKDLDIVSFSGTFQNTNQIKALRSKLPNATSVDVVQSKYYYDNGSINASRKILPFFLSSYTHGTLSYKNSTLSIDGMVKTQKDLKTIDTLLRSTNISSKNHTTIDPEELKKAKAAAERLKAEKERLRREEIAKQTAMKIALARKKEALAKENAALRTKGLDEKNVTSIAMNQKLLKSKQLKTKISKLFSLENIEFKVAKETLTNKGENTVSKLANILKEYPAINIEIAGHTDSDGSAELNQKLSQSRVDTVKNTLIKKGISSKRLTARGYGESKPLVPNTSDENKQKNRRVEINIQGE